jgi:hypothetical protein
VLPHLSIGQHRQGFVEHCGAVAEARATALQRQFEGVASFEIAVGGRRGFAAIPAMSQRSALRLSPVKNWRAMFFEGDWNAASTALASRTQRSA